MTALIVRFKSGLSFEELLKKSNDRADKYRATDGLLQKYYIRFQGDGEYGAVYLWESEEALEKFRSSDLAGTIAETYKTDGDLDLQVGEVIQFYAEAQDCSVVREFVGHGVGFGFHEAPQVPHFGRPGTGLTLIPGMVFTVEPMINLGNKELKVLDDNWTAVTKDGSLSAQFEQTILVTQDGFESLTPYEL